MNYLALDVGLRKIGMAIGSSIIREARPLSLISDPKNHVSMILTQVKQWPIHVIVMGDPGEREENKKLLEYISLLKKQLLDKIPTNCSIVDWSEQGSSQEAKMLQKETKKYVTTSRSFPSRIELNNGN